MTELEILVMLERCLELLVKTTPECKKCKMRWYDSYNERYICYFATECFCKEEYLKHFKKGEKNK